MIEIDEEKNPLWKPGTYPHDSGDGTWHKEFWAIKVLTAYSDAPNAADERWLTSLRCFASWADRIRFTSRVEARKWYWDTVLCHLPSYSDKQSGSVPTVRVTLVHVKPKVIRAKLTTGQENL